MSSCRKRIVAVLLVHLALFELVQQLAVHWTESRGEIVMAVLSLMTLAALVWAVSPSFASRTSLRAKVAFGILGLAGLGVGLLAVDNVYSWWVRPNVGLYQEADWVAQHPGFQRDLRAMVTANTWHRQAR